ncbi:MAG: hypothetical protein CMH26_00875 [Micavibrio sp.]|nr:hypothetical protein [Micavibrio sp.]|tara:strand:+ start:915 stop:1286 length:372 start_codon:yes stop_codon:yes gene_type:complete
MSIALNKEIRRLIDETREAYGQYDSVNADYAAFASMALSEFKAALGRPEMTGQELRRLLRKAETEHRSLAMPNASWASFMARYVSQNVNQNMNAPAQVAHRYQEELFEVALQPRIIPNGEERR